MDKVGIKRRDVAWAASGDCPLYAIASLPSPSSHPCLAHSSKTYMHHTAGEDLNQWRLLYENPTPQAPRYLTQLLTMLPIINNLADNQVLAEAAGYVRIGLKRRFAPLQMGI